MSKRRFLVGPTCGLVVGSLFLSAVVSALVLLVNLMRWADSATIVFLALVVLAMADFVNATPQWNRQVPQRFERVLTPGTRGFVWGTDLGLWVTTRKSSSVLWAVLIGSVATGRADLAVACVFAGNVAFSLCVIYATSFSRGGSVLITANQWLLQLRAARMGTSLLILFLAAWTVSYA